MKAKERREESNKPILESIKEMKDMKAINSTLRKQ